MLSDRFNEAAAYSCGKRHGILNCRIRQRRASMRPQHIAAENAGDTVRHEVEEALLQ